MNDHNFGQLNIAPRAQSDNDFSPASQGSINADINFRGNCCQRFWDKISRCGRSDNSHAALQEHLISPEQTAPEVTNDRETECSV